MLAMQDYIGGCCHCRASSPLLLSPSKIYHLLLLASHRNAIADSVDELYAVDKTVL